MDKGAKYFRKKKDAKKKIFLAAVKEYTVLVNQYSGERAMELHHTIQEWAQCIVFHYIEYKKNLDLSSTRKKIEEYKKSHRLIQEHINLIENFLKNPFIAKVVKPTLSWMNEKMIDTKTFQNKYVDLYSSTDFPVEKVPISTGITYNTMVTFLKDLKKLQQYSKAHRGAMDINKIISECNFFIIDESYLKYLYFTSRYDYKNLIEKEVKKSIYALGKSFSEQELNNLAKKSETSLIRITKTIDNCRLYEDL